MGDDQHLLRFLPAAICLICSHQEQDIQLVRNFS